MKRMSPCDILDMYISSNVHVAFKRREEGTGGGGNCFGNRKKEYLHPAPVALKLPAPRPAQRLQSPALL